MTLFSLFGWEKERLIEYFSVGMCDMVLFLVFIFWSFFLNGNISLNFPSKNFYSDKRKRKFLFFFQIKEFLFEVLAITFHTFCSPLPKYISLFFSLFIFLDPGPSDKKSSTIVAFLLCFGCNCNCILIKVGRRKEPSNFQLFHQPKSTPTLHRWANIVRLTHTSGPLKSHFQPNVCKSR